LIILTFLTIARFSLLGVTYADPKMAKTSNQYIY